MKKIDQKKILEAEIAYLKVQQAADLNSLKEQYNQTIESFTPINIIKNSFESILKSPNLKANLLNQALNYGVSFIAKNTLHSNVDFSMQGVLGKIFRFALKRMT
jgi:hypothetical protein